jgi:hypothetical protein
MRLRALAVVVVLGALAGCASKTSGVRIQVTDHAAAAGPHVEMHYLGNGGWLLRRGNDVVATAPFFTNQAGLAIYTWSEPDKARIDAHFPEMPALKTMLIGHSHYDHAMDLPHILLERATSAKLYGSKTVKHLLGETVGHERVVDVTDASQGRRAAEGPTPGTWISPEGTPVRFMALSSEHAPHVARFIKVVSWSRLTEDVPKGDLPRIPAGWPEGETLAFVIDFLRPDKSVEFRVYYQDAAAPPGKGVVPTLDPADRAPVDVAVLCVAAFTQVPDNPEAILASVRPRHVVGGHWEDFFSEPSTDGKHEVAFGTNLDEFVRRAHAAAPVPVYIPAPGKKLFIPIRPR